MQEEFFSPKANDKVQIKGDKFRFTILTERLIRIEYSENGVFEDRATQKILNRLFPTVSFSVTEKNGTLFVETSCMRLIYHGGEFSKNSLYAQFTGKLGRNTSMWYFGEQTPSLPGTNRTLDFINGETKIEKSLMSKSSMTVLDDSNSFIVCEDDLIKREKGIIDIYLFAYPKDYKALLRDFYTLTTNPPLLPRFALGNWWSRYKIYTDNEYISLMEKFNQNNIPFSVAVLDMDWHKTDISPKYGSGWTGFSWNRELFKNPRQFIRTLHEKGMKVTLNLHPAEGISAHEDCFLTISEKLGISASNIPFDITDKRFLKVYFEDVLKPLTDDGIDFFWIDWQQGSITKEEGLDPLWLLNHSHFKNSKKGGKRGLIFSRYAGIGSHRFPIGFSGDTHITWETLDFQPYFTACASNVGYGWWSHDIGGHLSGYRDDELENRWVQFGVFSPITRLHCAKNEFISREPWDFNLETQKSITKFLSLRHKLIPYIYTMNERAHTQGLGLITPVYYEYPENDDAYKIKNEYFFGTELLVCPITKKSDKNTNMGNCEVYLPKGTWFDFFNKYRYEGNRTLKVFRKYDEMPVFAKAGAIIPMSSEKDTHLKNPEKIIFEIFPGTSNSFILYEDDGITESYKNGKFLNTKIIFDWENKALTLKTFGDLSIIPENRNYEIRINCITECEIYSELTFESYFENNTLIIKTNEKNISFKFSENIIITKNDYLKKVYDILFYFQYSYDDKLKIYETVKNKEKRAAICDILAMDIDENVKNAVLEVLL